MWVKSSSFCKVVAGEIGEFGALELIGFRAVGELVAMGLGVIGLLPRNEDATNYS